MRSALINHPSFGSLWLDDAHVEGDYVVGVTLDDSGGPNYPDDWRGEMVTMNFPVTCIRKWEGQERPDGT